jgi:hypothetical protein
MVERAVRPHLSSFTFGRLGGRFCLREPPPQDCRTYLQPERQIHNIVVLCGIADGRNLKEGAYLRGSALQVILLGGATDAGAVAHSGWQELIPCCRHLPCRPPFWPVVHPAGVRKGIVQRTVSAKQGKRGHGRRNTVSYGPYDKLLLKGALTYTPGRDRNPHRLCPLLHRGKTLSPALLLVNGKPAQLLEEPLVCLTEVVAHHLKRVAVHLGQPRILLLQPGNSSCRS